MEGKGFGNIAEIAGIDEIMWVRVTWIEDIQRRFPYTYRDAVIKAVRKQAVEGRKLENPEAYIEAILTNRGKNNGKKK